MKLNTYRVQTAFMESGMGQAHLARKIGVSSGTISYILNGGGCSPRTLNRLAKELEVDSESLRG